MNDPNYVENTKTIDSQSISTPLENSLENELETHHVDQNTEKHTFDSSLYLTIGFIIWLLATLLIRYYGHFIFKANEPLLALGLYLVTSIAIIVLALWIYKSQKLTASQQFQAAILLALPGMILDSIVMVSFRVIFPNLAASSDSAIASWLLWSYAFVLLSGFLKSDSG